MKKIFRLAALSAVFGAPFMATAQTGVNVTYLQNYSNSITGVVNGILVPVLMAIAFIVFLWGVYKYFILGAADEKSRTDGRQFTLWGVIGFVVILSLWGIVNIFMSTLGLSVGTAPAYPTIGNIGGSQTTTGNPTFGGTSGGTGVTAAAQAEYNACLQSGSPNSQQCQTYTQHINAYNASLPTAGSATAAEGDSCTTPANCMQGLTCSSGKCVQVAAGSAAEGDNCADSSSCMQGLTCGPWGTCVQPADGSAAEGDACIGDSSCMQGLICGSNNTCVQNICNDSSASNYGNVGSCTYNSVSGNYGDSCTTSSGNIGTIDSVGICQ